MKNKPASDRLAKLAEMRAKAEKAYAEHQADLETRASKAGEKTATEKAGVVSRSAAKVRAELKKIAEGKGSDANAVSLAMDALAKLSEVERAGVKKQQQIIQQKNELAKKHAKESTTSSAESIDAVTEELESLRVDMEEQAESLLNAVLEKTEEIADSRDRLLGTKIGKELAKEDRKAKIKEQKELRKEFEDSRSETLRALTSKLKIAEAVGDKELKELLQKQFDAAKRKDVVVFENLKKVLEEKLEDADKTVRASFQTAEKMAARRNFLQRRADAVKEGFRENTIGKVKDLLRSVGTENTNLLSLMEDRQAQKDIDAAERLKRADAEDSEDSSASLGTPLAQKVPKVSLDTPLSDEEASNPFESLKRAAEGTDQSKDTAKESREGTEPSNTKQAAKTKGVTPAQTVAAPVIQISTAPEDSDSSIDNALEDMQARNAVKDTNTELRGINKSLAKIAKNSGQGGGGGGFNLPGGFGDRGGRGGPGGTGGVGKDGKGKPGTPGAPGGGDGKKPTDTSKAGKAAQFGKNAAKGVVGLTVGLAADWALGKGKEDQEEKGNAKGAAGFDVAQSAVSGAGYGAMAGSVIPGIGTLGGAAVGGIFGTAKGLWDNKDTLLAPDKKQPTDTAATKAAPAGGGKPSVQIEGAPTSPNQAKIAAAVSSVQASGAVPYSAPGASMTGDLKSLVAARPNVDLGGLTPDAQDRLKGLAADYTDSTGRKLQVNSGHRSFEKQAKLYADFKAGKPGANPANPPGSSLHEYGLAVDIQPNQVDEMAKMGLLSKHGFERISGSRERQHIQLAGVQKSIASGKSGILPGDAVGGEKIAAASRNKGGGREDRPVNSTVFSSMATNMANSKISVASSGDIAPGETAMGATASSSSPPSVSSGGRGSRVGRGSSGGGTISVATVPTFMYNDPAFYATNVQAMA